METAGAVGPLGNHDTEHASFGAHTWGALPSELHWGSPRHLVCLATAYQGQSSQWEPMSSNLRFLTAPPTLNQQCCGDIGPGHLFLPTTGPLHMDLPLPTGPACLLPGLRRFRAHLTRSPGHGSSLRAMQEGQWEWQPGPDF